MRLYSVCKNDVDIIEIEVFLATNFGTFTELFIQLRFGLQNLAFAVEMGKIDFSGKVKRSIETKALLGHEIR